MSQENVTPNVSFDVHQAVQSRYGAIARQTTGSCCGDSCECGASDVSVKRYDEALLSGVPQDAINLSLGCGDPVTIASLRPGETVLDLGSGGGIDCFMAARQVGAGGHVIGVDMTPEMLDKANTNKALHGFTNVEFRQGHIEALPVENSTVDVIMSNCVINLSPDKPSVFREAFRVLRPGGRISVSDIVTEGEFSSEQRADAAMWAECVSGAIDVADYTAAMAAAGFIDIKVVDKNSADDLVEVQSGMPRIYSARVTAQKPA